MHTLLPIAFLFALIHVTGSEVTTTKAPATVYTLGELTSHVNTLTQQLKELRADVAKKGTVIDSLNHRLLEKEKEMTSLVSRINLLESSVSFHVRFINDTVGNLTHRVPDRGYRLLFDAVRFQHGGNNYNRTTGLFTAPSNGTYAFYLTIMRNDPHRDLCVEATIFKNQWGQAVASACAPGYTTASNMVVLTMVEGDTASVHSWHPELIQGSTHTTFSGMKL